MIGSDRLVMMSSVKVECVVKECALIGEGPLWEESEQMLLFVDITGRKIHRWSPKTNQIQSLETGLPISMQETQSLVCSFKISKWITLVSISPACLSPGEAVGFVVPRRSGGYVAGVGRNFVAVDWSTQMITSLVEVDREKPTNRLNDGKVDPVGRLLAG